MRFFVRRNAIVFFLISTILLIYLHQKSQIKTEINICKGKPDEAECNGEITCLDSEILSSTGFIMQISCRSRKDPSPPRQASLRARYYEQDDSISFEDIRSIQRSILEKINSKLVQKYGSKYNLLEYDDSFIEANIKYLNREITGNNWEILKLEIHPSVHDENSFNIIVSAVLYVKSGFTFSSPPKSGYRVTNETLQLEEYIKELIVYLKS